MSLERAGNGEAGTVRVYLVRHGDTLWSSSGQHAGRTDLPLTAHGEDQASAIRPLLRGARFGAVFTRPMRRAERHTRAGRFTSRSRHRAAACPARRRRAVLTRTVRCCSLDRALGVRGAHFPLDAAAVSILGYEPSHPEISVIALWNGTVPPAPAPTHHAPAGPRTD
jgi:hypothetical protein